MLVALATEDDDATPPTRRGRALARRARAPRPAPAHAARGGRAGARRARPRARAARPAFRRAPSNRVEPASRPAFAALGDPRAVERAEEAWRKARGRESGEAAARVALGEALFVGGDPSCLGHFEAVVRSLAEIDAEVVYEAAYGLVAGRYAFGDPASARELASEMASRARVDRDRRFEAIFRLTRAHLDLRVDGAYEAMIAEAHRVLPTPRARPPASRRCSTWRSPRRARTRTSQAVAACRLAARSAVGGPLVAMLAHAVGEIELAAGPPGRRARGRTRGRIATATTGLIAADLARLTAGWARLELGAGDAASAAAQDRRSRRSRARCPRARRSRALAIGRRDARAPAPFQRAAQRWEGYSLARALRCRLGAGLAEIAQGRHVAAREHIESVVRARARARARTAAWSAPSGRCGGRAGPTRACAPCSRRAS